MDSWSRIAESPGRARWTLGIEVCYERMGDIRGRSTFGRLSMTRRELGPKPHWRRTPNLTATVHAAPLHGIDGGEPHS